MTKTAPAAAATGFFLPTLNLFLGLLALYLTTEILGRFLGLGEKKK
ncbi:MAG: hypothetical protein IKM94_02095 [Alphaproteobacteria bacterium]|nr:hypothetical protein [Alphaproteobacteria bacterium]